MLCTRHQQVYTKLLALYFSSIIFFTKGSVDLFERSCLKATCFCLQPPPEGSTKAAKVLLSERGPVYKPDMGIPPYASEVIHP